MKNRLGFTLVELVIVIAILGILAAVAIPKLFSITSDAQSSTLKGVAAALSSANSENYAVRTVNPSKGFTVSNCTDVSTNLLGGGLPSGYTVTSLAISPATAGTLITDCTLTQTVSGSTTSFDATYIP